MASFPKVYDFPMAKVEDRLVTFLRGRSNESTVADMIAGTGLPKYQVEQAARVVLDEYAGHLKATESGELLYYFPSGMRSRTRGVGPAFRRFWKTFSKTAAGVLTFLFKIWIVGMLVGYFVAFVAIVVVAMLATVAASAAARGKDSRSRGSGMGFGGSFLMMRLLDLALRMWFYSSLIKGPRRKPGRPFYKSVFAFVFGEGDPNKDWEEREKRYVLAYIRSRRGVITAEELMALTGKDSEEAQRLLNRYLLEFEGEPGVTEDGTVIFSFPELLRTSEAEQRKMGRVPLENPERKTTIPFSSNARKTNGWIAFFNAFDLAFGAYFLATGILQGVSAFSAEQGPAVYSVAAAMLVQYAGMSLSGAVAFMTAALGVVPVAFSVLFFLVPLSRKMRQERENRRIREEDLRKRIYSYVLANPSRASESDIQPEGSVLDPRNFEAARKAIFERFAAAMRAEPVLRADGRTFQYKFEELERQLADLEAHRQKVDLARYEVGKTVFDSGK